MRALSLGHCGAEETTETSTVRGAERSRWGRSLPQRAAEKVRAEVFRIAKDELAGDLTQLLCGGILSAINALASIVENDKADPAVRVNAARELLDRAVGKPMQSMTAAIATADFSITVNNDSLKAKLAALINGNGGMPAIPAYERQGLNGSSESEES